MHDVQPEQPLGQDPQLEQQVLHQSEQPFGQQPLQDLQLEQQVLQASQLEQQDLQESQPEQSHCRHGRITPAQFTAAAKTMSNAVEMVQLRARLHTF